MTSTDLAHALAIPLDTPGCWGCSRCKAQHDSDCMYCMAQGEQPLGCLWPLPDSGLPGAELWTYWLMRALGCPRCIESKGFGWSLDTKYTVLACEQRERIHADPWHSTPQAALYAAWKAQKNG